jgi:uncharacterized membrane protein YdbT with pleckstrin-like domain
MGYVDQNLITGESVTYRARPHWTAFLLGFLGGGLLVIAGALFMIWSYGEHQDSIPRFAIGLVLFVLGTVVEIVVAIRKSSIELAVTNKRVIFKKGLVQRKTTELFLNKIESVGVEQGIMGRMLNYGTVSLQGTGGSSEPIPMIARPLEFRRQVHEQIGKLPMEPRPSIEGRNLEGKNLS